MSEYRAPLADMRFALRHLAGMDAIAALPGFEDATKDVVDSVLEEAGRLASGVLAPLNTTGDRVGTRVENGAVVPVPGFSDAYQAFVEGGWPGLPFPAERGGQGLPETLATAVGEIWQAANMAFALCPMLTEGAVVAMERHASQSLRDRYVPKMVSGEWTGTMNLTEPQAGSDLAAVKTRAEPHGDHYLLYGQKIFITWGDHDMADNIVHMVLARLPDAPPGIKGISLFLVPKYLVRDDGTPGERNDVHPVSVEHKLGIHGSPTCVMSYGENGGAHGWLIGEAHDGISLMFTMMNHARVAVGIQGLSISERAYQHALAYARERVQGRVPGVGDHVTIIHHPDVRRMLMMMKAGTEAMRALGYVTAASMDFLNHHPDTARRAASEERFALLTPVLKAWCTELAQEITSLGIQVHGGMGYIEETGAAQHYRDARIVSIYEGTTGIQANDLVGRKILRDGGKAMSALVADMRGVLGQAGKSANAHVAAAHARLGPAIDALEQSTAWLLASQEASRDIPGSVAVNMVMLAGTVCGGWLMTAAALAAEAALADASGEEEFLRAKLVTARFYAEHYLPRAGAYARTVQAGADAIMALPESAF